METLRLNIAGRVYPLSVPAEEADGLRAAADAVSQQVEKFREQYQVQDRGDLLAMTALQLAAKPATPSAPTALSAENERRLDDLLVRLESALSGS